MGLADNYGKVLAAAKSFDAWQRGSHHFYSGKYNTGQSKYITEGNEDDSIWIDAEGESRLVEFADTLHEGYSGLSADKQSELLAKIGCNGCHDMVGVLDMVGGMLQEFNIDLRGSLRSDDDAVVRQLEEARAFFKSGLNGQGKAVKSQSSANWLMSAQVAFADEGDEDDESYVTASMALEDFTALDDNSYLIAVRDMDSLETSIMNVPEDTPGIAKLGEGLANLTITYTLDTEFEDDLDYRYVVTDIDYSNGAEGVYLVTGTVNSLSADGKSLVLDLNGVSELELDIESELEALPATGDYICARYAAGSSGLQLVDFDELEAPGQLVKVTYPVVKVAGTSMWLLENGDDAEDGYRSYLQVEYGTADVRSVPREGYFATVYYHDEAYGTVAGVDESALATASVAAAGTAIAAYEHRRAENEVIGVEPDIDVR